MSETPHIELTQAVDAAAREIYTKTVALQTEQGEARDTVTAVAYREWDHDALPRTVKNFWRRVAMAGLEGSVPLIARQAWDACVERINFFDDEVEPNPWAEDLDDELKRLL